MTIGETIMKERKNDRLSRIHVESAIRKHEKKDEEKKENKKKELMSMQGEVVAL